MNPFDGMKNKRWFKLGFVGMLCTTGVSIGMLAYICMNHINQIMLCIMDGSNQGWALIKNQHNKYLKKIINILVGSLDQVYMYLCLGKRVQKVN